MSDETRPFKVHFLDGYWADNSLRPEHDDRIARTYEVQIKGFESMHHIIREVILANPDDFTDGFTATHEAGHTHIRLLRPEHDAATWQGGQANSESVWLIADSRTGVVQLLPIDGRSYVIADDLRRTISDGYLRARPDEVIVFEDDGVGGGEWELDFVRWLLDQGVDLGLEPVKGYIWYKIISFLTKYVRNGRRDARARAVARVWAERQFHSPHQLRSFLDTKEAWIPSDLSRALTISIDTSRQLLKALGYEPDAGNTWRLGTSKRCRGRRQSWLDKEYADPLGFHFDNYPSEPFEG